MASFLAKVNLKTLQDISTKYAPFYVSTRGTAIPPKKKRKWGTIKNRNIIAASVQSLETRGFLRSQKPYNPPADIEEKLAAISKQVLGSSYENRINSVLTDQEKFSLLKTCFEELNHSVPSSLLHTIKSLSDTFQFYQTPVTTTTPYEELQNQELPPNLHIQQQYVRFHPDTDSMFKGITAFPESSTLVTSLEYKNKYRGHTQRSPFYYDNWSHYIKKDHYTKKP